MIAPDLALTLTGYALLDAVVTSTAVVTIVLVVAARRPRSTSASYAAGALGSFFVLTLGVYLGSEVMADVLSSFTLWIRRIALTLAAVFFATMGFKRLRPRQRKEILLPVWVNPWTALPFGALVMVTDIPFSFPMFLAVERLVDLSIETSAAVVIIAAYTLVSSLPTLAILSLGILHGERSRAILNRLLRRFTTGTAPASAAMATLHFTLAAVCAAIVFVV